MSNPAQFLMPPERSTVPAKRKAPAFKPPRPTTKAKESSKVVPSRRKSAPARPTTYLSSSEDEAAEESIRPTNTEATLEPSLTQDPPPTIPPKLLTKLLHHHFEDEKTRIGKDANSLIGKYMETFVREALARAAFERSEADGGRGGDFLEVDSLLGCTTGYCKLIHHTWCRWRTSRSLRHNLF